MFASCLASYLLAAENQYSFVSSFSNRLIHVKENHKFQKDGGESSEVDDQSIGFRQIVTEIKEQFSLK